MIKRYILIACGLFVTISMVAYAANITPEQLLEQVGLKPHDGQRGQKDIVGYAHTAKQMDEVKKQGEAKAAPCRKNIRAKYSIGPDEPFIAGICPHDDYYYASRLYSLILPHMKAKRIVIFGVFHAARVFNCKDTLVFDAFKTWHGCYGPVRVSPLRQEILGKLPRNDYIVNNDMQQVEHSVEAIVNYLQAYNKNVEIVSILVPYMNWDTMEHLAADLSGVLGPIIKRHHWVLGKDIAFICSTDAVHYGDYGWGKFQYAPFGTDVNGYKRAVAQDLDLAHGLCGTLEGKKLHTFLDRCVAPDNPRKYKITWCGRFAVPFGLDTVARIVHALGHKPLQGFLLGYGTSVSEASLDLSKLGGMGPTAPNNFHHFVGYAAIGYK